MQNVFFMCLNFKSMLEIIMLAVIFLALKEEAIHSYIVLLI